MNRKYLFACLVAVLPALSFCTSESSTPLQSGDRVLSIKANLGSRGKFDEVFDESREAGSETQVVPQDWRELETAPNLFEPETNFLAIANVYYPARKTPIHLAIRPIHTNQKVVPADLADIALDDPRTIRRFKRLLDWIATQIADVELKTLVIGSEVDVYMRGDADRWEGWIAFYAAVAPYARETFPGTLISTETTHAAYAGADLAPVRALHDHSDAIGVSYYPMQKNLTAVKPPASVHDDIARIVSAIPEKPIIYYQIGYPSSPVLGSSPGRQAEFITETFRAWDRYSGRIHMLNFQWMHEAPQFGVEQFVEYYRYDSAQFRAFLGSIGLKTWSGDPKPAWNTLIDEAKSRGFGTSAGRTNH